MYVLPVGTHYSLLIMLELGSWIEKFKLLKVIRKNNENIGPFGTFDGAGSEVNVNVSVSDGAADKLRQ